MADATSDHTIGPRKEVRHYNACTKVCIWLGAEVRLVSTDKQIHSYHVGPTLSTVSLQLTPFTPITAVIPLEMPVHCGQ